MLASIVFSICLTVVGLYKNQWMLSPSWVPEVSIENLNSFIFQYGGLFVFSVCAFPRGVLRVVLSFLSLFLLYAFGFSSFIVPCLFFVSATVVGLRILACWKTALSYDFLPIAALLGFSAYYVIIYFLAITPYNTVSVYSVILCVPLVLFRGSLVHAFRLSSEMLFQTTHASRSELLLWGLILLGFFLHLQNALRPEFDFDALASHLMVPHYVKAHGSWSFDYNQFVFGVNQLGADFLYTFIYVLSDERGVRFYNFLIFVLAGLLLMHICQRFAQKRITLLIGTIFFLCPLFVTQTSTLHVEGVWSCFLLGVLFLSLIYLSEQQMSPRILLCIAMLAGMALAIKMPSLFYLPIFAVVIIAYDTWHRRVRMVCLRSYGVALLLFVLIGIVPYAYCYYLTQNPVYPYFNGLFKSPFFYKVANFNNPLFNKPLTYRTIYDMTFHGEWYLESHNYPLSLYFLFFFIPIVVFSSFSFRKWHVVLLALLIFVSGSAIYSFQSYLRYVIPSFLFMLVLCAYMLQYLQNELRRVYVISYGFVLCMTPLSVIRFPDAAHAYREFNWERALTKYVKEDYIYQRPQQVIYDYLNTRYQKDSALLILAAPLAAGYNGTALVNAWYNPALSDEILKCKTLSDFHRFVAAHGITHVLFDGVSYSSPIVREFINSSTRIELDHHSLSLYRVDLKKIKEANLLADLRELPGQGISVPIQNQNTYIFEIELKSLIDAPQKWSVIFEWKNKAGDVVSREYVYNTVDIHSHFFEYVIRAPAEADSLLLYIPSGESQVLERSHYGLMRVAKPGSLRSYAGGY